MPQLVTFFFGALLVSLVALRWVGLHPVVPWSLIVVFALTVPFAYGLSIGAARLERSLAGWKHGVRIGGALVGLALPWVYQPASRVFQGIVLVLFSALAARLFGGPRDGFATMLLTGLLALGLSQAAISYLNYVALVAAAQRLRDPVLRTLDLQMYGALYNRSVDYTGIFPLVSSRLGFMLFERAYTILFAEMAVVVFALVGDVARLRWYLLRMFACYLVALGVFVLWPVVGPSLYYPESFRPGYEATTTGLWRESSSLEFAAIRRHLQPLTGFGYFVAVPSLHTAMALLCQVSLGPSTMLFWIFLPINILIVLSTVVLGYHYVLDVPAGIGLAAIVLALTAEARTGTSSRRAGIETA
jgi:membrane-associated phospholipid phosphatase